MTLRMHSRIFLSTWHISSEILLLTLILPKILHLDYIHNKRTERQPSFGHDDISTKLLKLIYPVIIKPFVLIINRSLDTGLYPDN